MAIVLLKSCQFAPHYEEPVVDLTDDVIEIIDDTPKFVDAPKVVDTPKVVDAPKTDNQPVDMEIDETIQPVEVSEPPLWKVDYYQITAKAKRLLKENGFKTNSDA